MLQAWKARKPKGSPKIVVVGSLLEVTPVTGTITSFALHAYQMVF